MNNIDIMRRTNRLARAYLKTRGHTVYLKHHTRFDKDIFGLFDGLTIDSNGKTFWVQIKTGYCPTDLKQAIYDWSDKHKQKAMIMQYLGKNVWKILRWEHDI